MNRRKRPVRIRAYRRKSRNGRHGLTSVASHFRNIKGLSATAERISGRLINDVSEQLVPQLEVCIERSIRKTVKSFLKNELELAFEYKSRGKNQVAGIDPVAKPKGGEKTW